MILERNGIANELKLLELAVSLKLQIKNDDASAKTSSTTKINAGTKAKSLSVSGRIGFKNAADLTSLVKLAEALNDDGTRAVYTIVDDTADAGDITSVMFNGDFDARKIPELLAWAVTFSLSEHLSTAERIEKQRQDGYTSQTAQADTAQGTEVAGEGGTDAAEETTEQYGLIWQALKTVDRILGELEED